MTQEELKVGMRVWCIGTYNVIGGIISEISNVQGLLGCFVVIDDDPNNLYIGLNCYMEADELEIYNPNKARPDPLGVTGNSIPLDEIVWE